MLDFQDMRRRTRWIAGLFAFVAMTLSVAETVWASTCAPMADMREPAASAQNAPTEHSGMPGMPGEPGTEGGEEAECPFSPATTAQGCSGAASLPAQAIGALAPAPERIAGVRTATTRQDPLLETALFHPPRA